jgi:hypothetical protein
MFALSDGVLLIAAHKTSLPVEVKTEFASPN